MRIPGGIIDAHAHFAGDTVESVAMLEEMDVRTLNVCVPYDSAGQWRRQAELYGRLAREHPRQFAWCTSFDPAAGDQPGHADRVIRGLEADFAAGAVGCKVWRNVGMELRPMVDDPVYEPVFAWLERTDRTLLMHIGEPRNAWLPLEGNPHRPALEAFPQYHLYPRRHLLPSYEALIASRDRVIERHPDLRIVGAHLGSLDHDLDGIARRLDRHPNFAIDVSARLYSLSLHPAEAVRRLILNHQDRIIYGTDVDLETPESARTPEEQARDLQSVREALRMAFDYFGSEGLVTVRYHQAQGLNLPGEVLRKLFAENARRWYPDLQDSDRGEDLGGQARRARCASRASEPGRTREQ